METIKELEKLKEDLEAQLAFENQRDLKTKENQMYGWNIEYHAGYMQGLAQAITCIILAINVLKKINENTETATAEL